MADRLDDAARRVLARARDLASQRKHETVDLDHVLLALLAESAVRREVESMAVSVEELDARLEAALAARVAVAAYRDAAPPTLAARLEAAVQRARPAGALRRFRRSTPQQLFRALLADHDVAQWVYDARLAAVTISSVLEHATLLATARRHAFVRVEHALLAVSDSEWLGAALEQLGASRKLFVEMLEAVLQSDTSSESYVGVAMRLDVFVRQSTAPTGSQSVEAIGLLIAVLRSPLSKPLFDHAGISRFDLLCALVGAATTLSSSPSEGGDEDLLDVVFHNDDFTTMEFVVATLTEMFGLSTHDAAAKMLHVHQKGAVVVGTFAADDARRRVRDALSRAEAEMMPLQISLRAPEK